mmetsp:Transcript_116276/g.335868  ORF Transcript_116276/g.335868 Transcript_116276/m.335868 type:complete len:242 (+) Transcript_116276:624-1349(+)
MLDAAIRGRVARDVRHYARPEEGAHFPRGRRDAVERCLGLRWVNLAGDHVRREVGAKVREEEGQAVDHQEQPRGLDSQPIVGQATNAKPHDHVGITDHLHILPPQPVDERHAHEVAGQHDHHDRQRVQAGLLQTLVAKVNDGGDVAVEQAVSVEHDVEEEPITRGAEHVPSVAPDGQLHVHAGAALLAGLLDLLVVSALVHLHAEVQGDYRHDCTEGQGEAPGDLVGGAGESEDDHDQGGQ